MITSFQYLEKKNYIKKKELEKKKIRKKTLQMKRKSFGKNYEKIEKI